VSRTTRINPHHETPVLSMDGGRSVTDTMAITAHLV
jgi:glutathione S-transferase